MIFVLKILVSALFVFFYGVASWAEVIKSIEITGNNRVSRDIIISQSGLKVGDNVNKDNMSNAIKKIYATENFADISININNGILSINVVETPVVGDVYFVGSSKFDADEIKKNMSTKSRQVYSKSRVRLDLDKFYATFQKMGYLHAHIEPKVVFLPSDNAVDIIFDINEGNLSKLSDINFSGNKSFSDRKLREKITSRQLSLFQIDHSSANFDEDKMNVDKKIIEDFYKDNGFANAKVKNTITTFDKKDYNFRLLFEIDEGDKYNFGTSTISSSIEKFQNDEEIKKLIKTKDGKQFAISKINETLIGISNYLASLGYANIKPSYDIDYDEDNKIANIEYNLKLSQKVYIDKILIFGNHKTKDNIILRELLIHEGDLYDIEKINTSRDRLWMLGYFKNVDIVEKPIPNTDLVQLEVIIEEDFFGKLNFTLGYSGYLGIMGSAVAIINNFLGYGFTLSTSFNRSGYMESYNVGFSDPYFFSNHNIGFSANVSFSRFGDLGCGTQYTSMMLYKGHNFGFTLGLSFELANRLMFHVSLSASRYVYKMLSSTGFKLYEQLMGTRNSYILGFGLSYNKMNRPRYPTKGYSLRYNVDFGGLGIPHGQQFIKNTLSAVGNLQIFGEDLILHTEASCGIVSSLRKNQIIGMENLFSLGGYSRMRGFNFFGIGPRIRKMTTPLFGDTTYVSDMYYASDGNKFYYLSAELRTPLFIPKDYGIYFSAFVDAGAVWGFVGTKNSENYLTGTGLNISEVEEVVQDSSKIRVSVGASITWRNPIIGEIGFYYAKPIVKQPYDTTLEFGINVGTQF